jgi:hypothetical protein
MSDDSGGQPSGAGKQKRVRTPEQILAREKQRLARYLARSKGWSPTGASRSVRTVSGGLPTLGKRRK